jgi:hypothetical protein
MAGAMTSEACGRLPGQIRLLENKRRLLRRRQSSYSRKVDEIVIGFMGMRTLTPQLGA